MNFKAYRLKAKISQEELARMTNVSLMSIGRYERGERTPPPQTAIKLGKILGFDWTLLYNHEAG